MEKHVAEILSNASAALRKAALDEDAKAYLLKNREVYSLLRKAANRYIGGETLEECLPVVRKLNDEGMHCTIDYMGESIRHEQDANQVTDEFVRLAQQINQYSIRSSISLDLSHIGLLVSKSLVRSNLERICAAAQSANQEVIISMEGRDRVDDILEIYTDFVSAGKKVGITLQAYLHRTKADFDVLKKLPGSIRIVKGAYLVPDEHSIARGAKLNSVYLDYVEALLSSDHPCSIASHDQLIHGEAIKLIQRYQPTQYVLERLLGIENEELHEYTKLGYNCRLYVVYGREWYLYLCNRWAEYPLAVLRAVSDIVA